MEEGWCVSRKKKGNLLDGGRGIRRKINYRKGGMDDGAENKEMTNVAIGYTLLYGFLLVAMKLPSSITIAPAFPRHC